MSSLTPTTKSNSALGAKEESHQHDGPSWWSLSTAASRLDQHHHHHDQKQQRMQPNTFVLFEMFHRNANLFAILRVSMSVQCKGPMDTQTQQAVFNYNDIFSDSFAPLTYDACSIMRNVVDNVVDGSIHVTTVVPQSLLSSDCHAVDQQLHTVVIRSTALHRPLHLQMKHHQPSHVFIDRVMQYLTFVQMSLRQAQHRNQSLTDHYHNLVQSFNHSVHSKVQRDHALSTATRVLMSEKLRHASHSP